MATHMELDGMGCCIGTTPLTSVLYAKPNLGCFWAPGAAEVEAADKAEVAR